jgi:autotransporter-associated beta strand protein
MKSKLLCHKTSLSTKTPVLVAVVVVSLQFANLSLGANRYWFGNDTIEGGCGNWHTGGHFSSTSPTYTPAGLPTTADDVYLQGVTPGTINLTTTVTQMKDLYVNTPGYIIDSLTPTVNFRVDNIYGPAANTLTITNSVNTSFNFVISAGFSPSFTGNFTQGTGTLNLRKQGDGIIDLTGAASVSYTGTTEVTGGILRMNISDIGSGNLLLGNVSPYVQGILETNGTFTRSLGASAGEVRMGFGPSMRSGFGAYGGALSVNFGGTSGTVNWADTSASNIVLQTFVVGTTTSTHTTTVVNPINISVTTAKTIRTEDGAAAIDADFSGTISSVAGGSLTKTGGGTTRFNNGISEVNLTVSEGTLIINGTISQTSDRNLTIQSGATHRGYATTSMTAQRNTTVQSDGILAPGRGNVVSDPFGRSVSTVLWPCSPTLSWPSASAPQPPMTSSFAWVARGHLTQHKG